MYKATLGVFENILQGSNECKQGDWSGRLSQQSKWEVVAQTRERKGGEGRSSQVADLFFWPNRRGMQDKERTGEVKHLAWATTRIFSFCLMSWRRFCFLFILGSGAEVQFRTPQIWHVNSTSKWRFQALISSFLSSHPTSSWNLTSITSVLTRCSLKLWLAFK